MCVFKPCLHGSTCQQEEHKFRLDKEVKTKRKLVYIHYFYLFYKLFIMKISHLQLYWLNILLYSLVYALLYHQKYWLVIVIQKLKVLKQFKVNFVLLCRMVTKLLSLKNTKTICSCIQKGFLSKFKLYTFFVN